jgi:hypothetical protein
MRTDFGLSNNDVGSHTQKQKLRRVIGGSYDEKVSSA